MHGYQESLMFEDAPVVNPITLTEKESREIPLTKGMVTIVDAEDYERLMKHKWHVMPNYKAFYASRQFYPPGMKGKGVTLQMHRVILGLTEGDGTIVDHKDRNGLNNRKNNLRVTTPSLSAYNRGQMASNTSGYRGVYLFKNRQYRYWRAVFRKKHLGTFLDKYTAALAYNEAAIKHYGNDAILNIIPEGALR